MYRDQHIFLNARSERIENTILKGWNDYHYIFIKNINVIKIKRNKNLNIIEYPLRVSNQHLRKLNMIIRDISLKSRVMLITVMEIK